MTNIDLTTEDGQLRFLLDSYRAKLEHAGQTPETAAVLCDMLDATLRYTAGQTGLSEVMVAQQLSGAVLDLVTRIGLMQANNA
jgi:hypothetical protein